VEKLSLYLFVEERLRRLKVSYITGYGPNTYLPSIFKLAC
jgi:hypothetical protein